MGVGDFAVFYSLYIYIYAIGPVWGLLLGSYDIRKILLNLASIESHLRMWHEMGAHEPLGPMRPMGPMGPVGSNGTLRISCGLPVKIRILPYG